MGTARFLVNIPTGVGIRRKGLESQYGRGDLSSYFRVPEDWRGKNIRLWFDGVMTDTDVIVNGVSAGETHRGGFYRFSYDITSLLKYGAANKLEVRVKKTFRKISR